MPFPRARFGGTGVESQHPAYGRSLRVLVASVAGVVVLGCSEQMPEPSAVAGPKLILLIGDGMDGQQITVARNYLTGSTGRLTLDGLPCCGPRL